MALNETSLRTIRSDLAARLDDIAPNNFSEEELNYWLNLSQQDVARRLSSIANLWYGTSESISLTATNNSITTVSLTGNYAATKVMKFVKLILANGTNVPFIEDFRIHTLLSNTAYDGSYFVNWFGENLYLFVGSSATALSGNSATLFFIRKPTDMSTDASTVDVPLEYQDLVVLSALSKAATKLNMQGIKQIAEQDLNNKLNEVRNVYALDTQVKQVEEPHGVQTPRMN